MPLGLLSVILRLFRTVVAGVWLLPRLDMSTMSRSFESFDAGLFYIIFEFIVRFSIICLYAACGERAPQSNNDRILSNFK